MNFRRTISCLCFVFILARVEPAAAADESRWWPVQTMPKALVRLENSFPSARLSYEMMAQSVAGLAAKAVNEARGDELVWISTGNPDEENWLARLLERHPQLEIRETPGLWDLVDRYARKGLIKGYILYRADRSEGDLNRHRVGLDNSVNVATSLAGLFDGILVDENIQREAKAHGLKMLMDARDRTPAWVFATYLDQFNRRMVCAQDPRKPNVRDLAIAQKAFTTFGGADLLSEVMKWLEPLSPVLGWDGGDEFRATDLSSRWAQLQTATDWCMNLPVLMAGTESARQSKVRNLDPSTIDWNDRRSAVAFVSTDGDNVQWFEGNFFRSAESRSYWSNPGRGKIPFGWSCCFSQLAQLCPEGVDYTVETQTPNDEFIEWGGGYYYPDRFARDRSNRWELLAQHARDTWAMMRKNNTRVIGFNVAKFDSPDARKAYEVVARQTDGLLGILIFQYDRYEAGAGRVFWVKDQDGVEVPVVTARYSIWSHANDRPRSGTPAKVTRDIRRTLEATPTAELPRYDWVIAHVWSWFKRSTSDDVDAEDMPQEGAVEHGGERGYAPVTWCAARLPANIRTVGPEELLWRIRMRHNPEQTRRLIREWPE